MNFRKIKIFVSTTLYVTITILVINFISGYFSARVDTYVKQKAILEASYIIARAIETEVLPNIDLDSLVVMNLNENSQVESVFINTYQINKILSFTTQKINESLYDIDNEELTSLTLPFGIIISDTLFSQLGPGIKIRISPVGSVKCDVQSKSQHYGINNTLLTIDIVTEIQITTVIPLRKQTVNVVTKIPIVVQIIQGQVPRYYFSGPVGYPNLIPQPWDNLE